jgi:hypothetical protein
MREDLLSNIQQVVDLSSIQECTLTLWHTWGGLRPSGWKSQITGNNPEGHSTSKRAPTRAISDLSSYNWRLGTVLQTCAMIEGTLSELKIYCASRLASIFIASSVNIAQYLFSSGAVIMASTYKAREFMCEFIEVCHSLRALWQVKSEEYVSLLKPLFHPSSILPFHSTNTIPKHPFL